MYSGFGVFCNDCMMNVGVCVCLKLMLDVLCVDVVWIGVLFVEGLDWFGGLWLVGDVIIVVDVFFVLVVWWVWMYVFDVGVGQVWIDWIIVYFVMLQWEMVVLVEIWCEVEYEVELFVCGDVIVDY